MGDVKCVEIEKRAQAGTVNARREKRLRTETDGAVRYCCARRNSAQVGSSWGTAEIDNIAGFGYGHVDAENGCVRHTVQAQYRAIKVRDCYRHPRARTRGQTDHSSRDLGSGHCLADNARHIVLSQTRGTGIWSHQIAFRGQAAIQRSGDICAGHSSGANAVWGSRLIYQRQSNAADDDDPGRGQLRWVREQPGLMSTGKSSELRCIRGGADHSHASDRVAVLEEWNSSGIRGGWIAVQGVSLAGNNACSQTEAVQRTGRGDAFSRQESGVQRTASVGVLDAVQIAVGGILDAWRKVYPTDEAHSTARERCLVVAEEGGGTSQCDGQFLAIDGHSEVSGRS